MACPEIGIVAGNIAVQREQVKRGCNHHLGRVVDSYPDLGTDLIDCAGSFRARGTHCSATCSR